jgi:hypothetical protein
VALDTTTITPVEVAIMISFINNYCKQGSYWTKGTQWITWSHHFKCLCNIYVTNDHGYVPFAIITIKLFPHSWFVMKDIMIATSTGVIVVVSKATFNNIVDLS